MGTPTGITLNEAAHPFTFLISEDSDGAGYLSRDEVVIAASQSIVVGQVLSKVAVPANVTAAASAGGSNTGNGTLALASPATDTTVIGGDYRVEFTAATTFNVRDPNGKIVGKGSTGSAFAAGVKFTITAGGTAFVAGDFFTINVDVQSTSSSGDEQYSAWAPGAKAVAIAGFPVTTAAGATARITVINAHATVRLADLTFGGSPTQAQIDQAMRDLGANLIKFR